MNTYSPLRVLDTPTDLIHYPVVFKLVIVGEASVGKSSIMNRYLGEGFYTESFPTIGKF